MTQQEKGEELADYYDERRGDVSLWEEKPTPIRVRRGGPSTVFSVRFTPDELKLLQAAASAQGTTISELVRAAALAAASTQRVEKDDLRQAALTLRQIADLLANAPIK